MATPLGPAWPHTPAARVPAWGALPLWCPPLGILLLSAARRVCVWGPIAIDVILYGVHRHFDQLMLLRIPRFPIV